jgi:glutamine amidotransferase
MIRLRAGIIDYGVGNHTSVERSIYALGHRCRISSDPELLDKVDLLILPGVGAFSSAMASLESRDLHTYITESVERGRPLVGICLGMQMLTEASSEYGHTAGLGLIPGQVTALKTPQWHIGWNELELTQDDPLLRASAGQSFYFNHSYAYEGPETYQVCRTPVDDGHVTSVIRREHIIGVQFHPEKSQGAGLELMRHVIEGLCGA